MQLSRVRAVALVVYASTTKSLESNALVPFIVTKVPASIARTHRRDKTCVRLL